MDENYNENNITDLVKVPKPKDGEDNRTLLDIILSKLKPTEDKKSDQIDFGF